MVGAYLSLHWKSSPQVQKEIDARSSESACVQFWYIINVQGSLDYWEKFGPEKAAYDHFVQDYYCGCKSQVLGREMPEWVMQPDRLRPKFFSDSRFQYTKDFVATLAVIDLVLIAIGVTSALARAGVSAAKQAAARKIAEWAARRAARELAEAAAARKLLMQEGEAIIGIVGHTERAVIKFTRFFGSHLDEAERAGALLSRNPPTLREGYDAFTVVKTRGRLYVNNSRTFSGNESFAPRNVEEIVLDTFR